MAIDEASECPALVRTIIHNRDAAADSVTDMFKQNLGEVDSKNIVVRFSVAGTGAFASTVGSKQENFKNLNPSFVMRHRELRNRFLDVLPEMLVLGGGGERKKLSECIEECLPVVAVMMENGRMASIASNALQEQDELVPIVESTLVETIALKFMRSNGLEKLVNNPNRRHRVAAAALAVHLFQGRASENFPENKDDYERKALDMDFVLTFAEDIIKNGGQVKRIVSKYGLLEPNYNEREQIWGPSEAIKRPFLMTASQQIIALYMLDVKLESMLEATPYGFETLTSHMVKCAVAASLAVSESKRPNLQAVLALIGFQVCENSTDDDIREVWKELKEYRAIGSKCVGDVGEEHDTVFRSTRQFQVELLIETKPGEGSFLVIDKHLHKALKNLKPNRNEYSSPITCVNYGSSPFADGFITFHLEKIGGGPSRLGWKKMFPFTIMNQSKDYHSSSLDTSKLQLHAKRGKHKLVDPLFGDIRLLCVSSSTEVLIAKTSCKAREFLPYCVDQSALLKDLLKTLQSQRAKKQRLHTHAYYCDEKGEVVQRDRVD